jgi:hypothetical protein
MAVFPGAGDASVRLAFNDASGVEQSVTATNALPIEPLGQAGVARKLTADASSANTALTSTCKRITMRAVTADIRYSIGTTSQTATTNSHFIASGERLDLAVPLGANIGVIRDAATSGTLELTELV